MSTCGTSYSNSVRLRTMWHADERTRVPEFLNEYFDRTADWSNSVADMHLVHMTGKPYARLVVTGDFYVESGLRMDHFAVECSGKVVLVAVDDEEALSYHILD